MNRLQALRQAKAAAMTGQGPLAPGVIQVRLTGDQDDTAAAASVLAAVPGLEILTGPDGPYPNRRSPGQPALPHRAAHPATHHRRRNRHRRDGRTPR